MIRLTSRADGGTRHDASLTLPFEDRQKTRLRTRLDSGEDAGLFLERGSVLRGGEVLLSDCGRRVMVHAAAEPVSTARTSNPFDLTRAAYHLGNRHVPLEVGDGWLRYLRDHVLDEMVLQLGLAVVHENAPFEPESGAYGHGHHGH